MEKNSRLASKSKSLIGFMFLFCVVHSVTLYGMFTRPSMPARFRPKLTPEQKKNAADFLKKEAEEDRKAEEENLERIRLKDLKLQEEAKERKEKKYKEILQEGQRAQFLKSIRVQASDGVTTIPLSIAKRSKILSSLGDISKDPIPLDQYSLSVIRDVCNIIPQRFINPEKIKKQIEQYSLQQLVERFKFLHDLDFSSSIQDIFKQKIIEMTQFMSFQRVIDNKDAIKMIDSDIPEFSSLTKMAKIPYVTITDGQYEMFHIPEHIYTMSGFLSGALHYNKKKEIILDKDLADSLLKIMDIINLSKNNHQSIHRTMEYMGYDSLTPIIPIINCLDYLSFSNNIQREFRKELYSFCQEVPFDELLKQLKTLSSNAMAEVFGNPIIDKLKSSLLEKALTMDDRKTILEIGWKVAFSPNNKMFATAHGKKFQLWKFNEDESTSLSQELFIKDEISCIAFSANNKKLSIGTHANENNILLYDIDKRGIVNQEPQILIGHQRSNTGFVNEVYAIAFSPNGKFMVSANSHAHSKNILLWTLKKDGSVNEKPLTLISNESIISPITFNDDGTIFIISKNLGKKMTLSIFNDNCSLKSKLGIEGDREAYKVVFYHHDKKFIAASSYGNEHFFHMYDFNNESNITSHQIFHYSRYMELFNIFNDITVIGKLSHPSHTLLCIDVSGLKDKTQIRKYEVIPTTNCQNACFRPDAKKMILSSHHDSIHKIYHNTSQAALYTILTDEEEQKINNLKVLDGYQLLLIDKMLSGGKDLPSLEDYEVPQKIIDLLNSLKLIP